LFTLGGFNASRRMSERDLPSKVEFTDPSANLSHQNLPPGHPLLQPRIHSSKSVPSLNSDQHHPQSNNTTTTVPPPMIRSPGHNPGPMSHHGHNNMDSSLISNGPRYPQQYYPSASMTMQPSSKTSGSVLPHTSQHMNQGNNNTNMDHHHLHNQHLRSRSIQSLTDPPYRPELGNKQPSNPTLHSQAEEPERFYQNVGFYPPPPVVPPPSNPANMPVRTYIPYSNSTGNISSSGGGGFRSPTGNHSGANMFHPPVGNNSGGFQQHHPGPSSSRHQGPPNLNTSMPGNLNWARSNAAAGQQQQQHNPGNPIVMSQPHNTMNRDLLRQEAKMLEMQDELRRREERAAIMMNKAQQQSYPQKQQQQQHVQQISSNGRIGYPPPGHQQQRPLSGSGPPPAAPKPYSTSRPGDLQLNSASDLASGRSGDDYRHHQPQFSASMGEIPKGAFSYNNGMIPAKSAPIPANPWDREAKEVEAGRKKEAAKYWRDQQIHELEVLPHKTPSQEEQLRALKLEREFQRRAEEMKRDDDGENYEEEEDDQNERKAMIRRLQEDLERTRISASSNGNGGVKGLLDPMEEERARKIEEMRRKKLELEAAQAAEERLVREAAKRRVSSIIFIIINWIVRIS